MRDHNNDVEEVAGIELTDEELSTVSGGDGGLYSNGHERWIELNSFQFGVGRSL